MTEVQNDEANMEEGEIPADQFISDEVFGKNYELTQEFQWKREQSINWRSINSTNTD